jgi:uncharacterized caspase-like protein/tetratricopeptide (TPR) repeat protein
MRANLARAAWMRCLTTSLLLSGTLAGCSSPEKVPVSEEGVPNTPLRHQVMKPVTEAGTDAPVEPRGEPRAAGANGRYALLVGVDGYGGDLAPLRFAARDMRALAWALTTYGGYTKENVRLLVDSGEGHGKPTKAEILEGLNTWSTEANLGDDDTVFFAFSGHGFTDGNRAYLMPLDADTDSPQRTALPVEKVYELLGKTGAGQRFIVVDACRNSPTRAAADNGRVSRSQLQAKEGSSICQLFSCDDGQVSLEDESLESMLPGEKGHGIFTHFLVRGLAGEANIHRDGEIELAELYEYTHQRVDEYVRQHYPERKQTVREVVDTNRPKLVLAKYLVPPSRELASLPGLGGRWWFEEAPWLLPHLREKLPTYVDELKGGDDQVRKFLHDVDALQVYGRLKAGFDECAKKQPREMRNSLQQIVAEDTTKSLDDQTLPKYFNEMRALSRDNGGSGHHTLAVLHHRRYLQGAVESERLARDEYKTALKQYAILNERGLYARCLADLGLFYSATGERLRAAQLFAEARETIGPDEATFLHVECLIREGDARRGLREFDVAKKCYEDAYDLCSSISESGNAHPLAITAMKQKGWCFMDEWRVMGARDAFEQAWHRSQDHRKLNPASEHVIERWVIEFHIEHGRAMCDRYGGDLKAATAKYEELVDSVDDKYKTWDPGDPHIDTLASRLANTFERLGDCYLQGRDRGAVSSFRSSRDYYKELAGSLQSQLETHCKLAIAQAVTRDDFPGAESTLNELDAIRQVKVTDEVDEAKRSEFERIFTEIATYEKVARAIVQAGTDAELDRLKETVAEPATNWDMRDKLNRDEVDLYLVAVRELIRRLPGDDPTLPKVVEQLYDMIPPRQGANRLESLAYRREYYDIGLVAWLKQLESGDLDTLIDHIVQAKTNHKYGRKSGKNILVFYFPKDVLQRGYCVWRPSHGVGTVFPLEIGWEKLSGQKAALPANLLEAMRQLEGPIEVQWSDRVLERLGLGNIDDLPYLMPENITYVFTSS